MNAASDALAAGWWAVAVHLWQSTLFLLPLLGMALLLRGAPARMRSMAWQLALAKLLMPLGAVAAAAAALAGWGGLAPVAGAAPVPPEAFVVAMDVLAPAAGAPAPSLLPVVLTLLWLAGASLLLVRWIRAARRAPASVVDPAATARLHGLLAGTGLHGDQVRLVEGGSPCVRGAFRPRVDVPLPLLRALDDASARAMLLHEAAHVSRRDPLREVVLRAVTLAFYYYPPLWLILRGIRASAELECDERAREHGAHPSSLATALAASVRHAVGAPAHAMASLRPRSLLRERFRRLDQPEWSPVMPGHRLAVAASSLLVLGSLAGPALVGASRGAPVLTSLRAPAVPVDLKAAGVRAGEELVVRVRARVGSSGHVEDVKILDGPRGIPFADAEALDAAARQAVESASFTAGSGRAADAIVELAWQVGPSQRLGAGQASIVPTRRGARAIIGSPARIGEGITPPVLAHKAEPEYPDHLKTSGIQGEIVLETQIGADGSVTILNVLKDLPEHPELTDASRAAVSQWTYEPALQDGQPVSVILIVRLKFRLGTQE